MRSGHAAILGAAACLALLGPGCGEDETAATGDASRAAAAAPSERAANALGTAPAAATAPPGAADRRCARSLGELVDALESMANGVAVGLDYERYLDTVDRVRAVYAGVDADRLGLVCLGRVAGPAERSLNLYVGAANAWGECLADGGCRIEALEPRLQRRWREASNRLAQARRALRPG